MTTVARHVVMTMMKMMTSLQGRYHSSDTAFRAPVGKNIDEMVTKQCVYIKTGLLHVHWSDR